MYIDYTNGQTCSAHLKCLFYIQQDYKCFFFFPFIILGLPKAWKGEPHIAVHPKPKTILQGERLTLLCSAFGIPMPQYQWYRNGHPLHDKTTDTLQVGQVVDTSYCLFTPVLKCQFHHLTTKYQVSFNCDSFRQRMQQQTMQDPTCALSLILKRRNGPKQQM